MQPIEIELGPPWPSYSSFAESVAAADAQPGQAKAKQDSQAIAGSTLESGQFGQSRCVLQFSNGWHLVAEARDFHVDWAVSDLDPPAVEPVAPRRIRSVKSGREWEFDPTSMISSVIGSELVMLRATGRALLVYTRSNGILWLSAYRELASRQDLLHAVFET
jgi:hypothetical protein